MRFVIKAYEKLSAVDSSTDLECLLNFSKDYWLFTIQSIYSAYLEKSGLGYVWQGVVIHNTGHNITWPRRMISGYKPILIYCKPGDSKINWSPFLDVCSDGKQE